MNARRTHTVLVSTFGALLVSGLALQDQFAEVEFTSAHVAGSVWWLAGAGGNIGLSVGEDGVFVVDDQFAPLAPKIEAAIDGVSEAPLRYLVNTHWHGDHTGGNAHFGREATIVAHENVRRRLTGDTSIGGRVAESPVAGTPVEVPVITFRDNVSFHLNGEEIELLHLANAHTDGDSVVWFKGSNVLHLGDLFFENQYPFVDVSSGGSVRGLLDAIERLLALAPADAKIVPGHGVVSDVAGLREYHEMLVEVVERVEAEIAQGLDAETMLANGLLGDFDERWGQGPFMTPDRFLGIIAADLAP